MRQHPNDNDLFDTFCRLRELYGQRGLLDREAGLSVDAVVVYGESLLRIARRREEHASRRHQPPAD
jgi:hypothetical protein